MISSMLGVIMTSTPALRTLAIDIGGTGIKALVLGPDGAALTERVRRL